MIINLIKKYFNTIKEVIKDLPEDYETIKKKNEMTRKKINEEYEKFKQSK